MIKWLDKFFSRFKNKINYPIIINDSCDLLALNACNKGKVLIIKSGNIDFFIADTFTPPCKFFLVDIFTDTKQAFIDINNKSNTYMDKDMDKRVKLRMKLSHGEALSQDNLEIFMYNLINKGVK